MDVAEVMKPGVGERTLRLPFVVALDQDREERTGGVRVDRSATAGREHVRAVASSLKAFLQLALCLHLSLVAQDLGRLLIDADDVLPAASPPERPRTCWPWTG